MIFDDSLNLGCRTLQGQVVLSVGLGCLHCPAAEGARGEARYPPHQIHLLAHLGSNVGGPMDGVLHRQRKIRNFAKLYSL